MKVQNHSALIIISGTLPNAKKKKIIFAAHMLRPTMRASDYIVRKAILEIGERHFHIPFAPPRPPAAPSSPSSPASSSAMPDLP